MTFTKEQKIAAAQSRIWLAEMMLPGELEPLKERSWSIELELARIALASLEAEAVAYMQIDGDDVEYNGHNEFSGGGKGVPLYTAPPVPVSVPDEATPENIEILASTFAPRGVTYQWDRDECNAAADSWNACRAALLQGKADGNSPVIPDGWVACSERMPENDDFVYIWPRPDFGVELHVAQYGKFDKRDAGWYAQVYEQNYGIEYYPVKVTHWMPLPAAPQRGDSF